MMTPRQHWTLLAAYALWIVFNGVFWCYLVPELVDYLLGGQS